MVGKMAAYLAFLTAAHLDINLVDCLVEYLAGRSDASWVVS